MKRLSGAKYIIFVRVRMAFPRYSAVETLWRRLLASSILSSFQVTQPSVWTILVSDLDLWSSDSIPNPGLTSCPIPYFLGLNLPSFQSQTTLKLKRDIMPSLTSCSNLYELRYVFILILPIPCFHQSQSISQDWGLSILFTYCTNSVLECILLQINCNKIGCIFISIWFAFDFVFFAICLFLFLATPQMRSQSFEIALERFLSCGAFCW